MAQLTPIRGFVNMPVTKNICIFTTVSALLISILQIKYILKLSIDPFILEYNQYWRIITFQLSVINESDYLLCIILWFHFKNLERFYGSNKYLSLIIIFALYNCVLLFMTMSLGQLLINFIDYLLIKFLKLGIYKYFTTFLNTVAPGPLGILSSLYVCYGSVIPSSYQFKIVLTDPSNSDGTPTEESQPQSQGLLSKPKELVLTDNFQIHILFTVLLFNNGFASLLPMLIGLVIGKLFTKELLPGSKTWLLPSSVFKIFINPFKYTMNLSSSLRRRFTGYQPVTTEMNEGQEDDREEREEIVDDIRNNNDNVIRAETPVRPLASQFLDTFRTGNN